MPKALTIADCEARAIAADEAAEHLQSNWTHDSIERSAGTHILNVLRNEAASWRGRAVREHARRQKLSRADQSIAQRAASYVVHLCWAGDCVAIWNYAIWPLFAMLGSGLYLQAAPLVITAFAAIMLLFLGVGLAAHAPIGRPDGVIEAAVWRRCAAKERAALVKGGLTPQRYLNTFSEERWIERAMAAHRLGVSNDGRTVL